MGSCMTDFISSILRKYCDNYTGLPAACWGAIILVFLQCIASGICYFVSLYFVNTLHIDVATAGVMLSCYGAGTVCGGALSGKLCDKFSPRSISVISLVIESSAFIFLALLRNPTLLLLNMFIL